MVENITTLASLLINSVNLSFWSNDRLVVVMVSDCMKIKVHVSAL